LPVGCFGDSYLEKYFKKQKLSKKEAVPEPGWPHPGLCSQQFLFHLLPEQKNRCGHCNTVGEIMLISEPVPIKVAFELSMPAAMYTDFLKKIFLSFTNKKDPDFL
jgi:hypothetical protein